MDYGTGEKTTKILGYKNKPVNDGVQNWDERVEKVSLGGPGIIPGVQMIQVSGVCMGNGDRWEQGEQTSTLPQYPLYGYRKCFCEQTDDCQLKGG